MSTKTLMTDIELALLVDRFMRRIHAGVHRKAPQFDTERVGPGGGMILLTLADLGPAQMQELARRLARDKSQMTRAVRALEQKGLISRTASPEDGRASVVTLTQKGRRTVDTLRAVLAETIDEILGPIGDDKKQQLQELLRGVAP